jgi:phage gp45-like
MSTIRRLTISLTAKALWQLVGVDNADTERQVEVFSGIGFFARPPDDSNSEVIVVKVGGGSEHPVIIATRDEQTRQAFVAIASMLSDESAMYNSQVRVHCQGGEVFVDDGSGAVPLALKSDVDTIRSELNGHEHTYIPTSGVAQPPVLTTLGPSVTAPSGTTILRGK